MAWTPPTAADFKTFFARDFQFAKASDPMNFDFVTDTDIDRAIAEGLINFNPMYGTDPQITNVFLYLAAFCLVRNLQDSAKGISSQPKFIIGSASVGSVSINSQIPEIYLKDPFVASFAQNGYGLRYLELAWPYLVGNVHVVRGGTTFG